MHDVKFWDQNNHRRRMETEDKARVVVSVWGVKCVQFLVALSVLPRSFERKGWIQPFFQIYRDKTASMARNWTNSAPQTDATTFALSSNSILLLWLPCSLSPPSHCSICVCIYIYCTVCDISGWDRLHGSDEGCRSGPHNKNSGIPAPLYLQYTLYSIE